MATKSKILTYDVDREDFAREFKIPVKAGDNVITIFEIHPGGTQYSIAEFVADEDSARMFCLAPQMAEMLKMVAENLEAEDLESISRGEGVSRKHATMTNYIWGLLSNTDYARGM